MESAVRGARMGGGGGGGGGTGAEALPLPPPPRLAAMSASSPASIRALLARTASGGGGGGVDCQSPRSLLSRILQRGDGGSGGGFGCRVRLPRRYGSSSGGGGREERKDGAAEQAGDTAMVKLVERAPELPVETPRSSLGKKKPEEEVMSMNLGLGASLVLLLSKSAVELNKMVELRAQMEALVSEIRQETQGKEKNSAPASSSSSQESNGSTTTVIKDPIARATSEDALSNCFGRTEPDNRRAVVVMDQMEAELQVELSRLQIQQRTAHGEKRVAPMQMQGLELPLLQVKTKSVVSNSPSRSCVDDDGVVVESGNAEEEVDDSEEEEEEEEEYEEPEYGDDDDDDDEEEEEHEVVDCRSPPHGGVSARALERRLHELLQRRQQKRIVELESALDSVQRRLQEREREVVWWRDAAKLVSHRRDESRRLR